MKSILSSEKGIALITVLFVMIIFFVLVGALLFQSLTERVVVVNETDHLKALGFSEAGLAWATRRVSDSAGFTDLLLGPDPADSVDDHLLGLRDLSLTATSQFTAANEGSKSAIVSRDFGDGIRDYEVIRIVEDTFTRALVYVRIDDNFDDDPDDPANDDELADTDQLILATAVAEYPVFVDATGAEQPNPDDRGRARRMVRVTYTGGDPGQAAIASNGDIDIPGDMKLCGECGSIHSNQDMDIGGDPYICQDATASGSFAGGGTIDGDDGGGYPVVPIPVINPYDDIFVPSIDTFDTSGDGSLPLGLRCPRAVDVADPGANKYFALVADGDKGRVFKAYWDFANDRWTWAMIDNLASGNTILDDCGRVQGGDPNFRAGAAGPISAGLDDQFYGFKGDKMEWESCNACGVSGDASLCAVGNNDFTVSGFYPKGSAIPIVGPILPGSFQANTFLDLKPDERPKTAKWDYSSSSIYSPLYGAVIWVYGNMMISGNPGDSSSVDFQCSSGAGCSSGTLPYGTWKASFISLGDIEISGQANLGPANPDDEYYFLLVAGRDIMLNGNPQEDSEACTSDCATTARTDIADIAGIYAAHEQIQISGNPNIFGFMLAEDAIDCSPTVDGQGRGVSTLNGNPNVFYDCLHPPNPWAVTSSVEVLAWHELE